MNFKVNRADVYDELRSDADRQLAVLKGLLDEDGYEAEKESLEKEIDRLLTAFYYVQDGRNWEHVDLENEGNAFDDFCFGSETNLIADSYFTEAKFKSKLLDWYLVDATIASAFEKTRKGMMRIATPRLYKLTHDISRSSMYWLSAWYVIVFLLKWVIMIALIGGTFAMGFDHGAWFAVSTAIVGFLFYRKASKRKSLEPFVKEQTEKLMMIKRVYALCSTSNIDWAVLQSELEETRSKGIEWPSSLYSAIRSRLATQD